MHVLRDIFKTGYLQVDAIIIDRYVRYVCGLNMYMDRKIKWQTGRQVDRKTGTLNRQTEKEASRRQIPRNTCIYMNVQLDK